MSLNPLQPRGQPKNKAQWVAGDNSMPESTLEQERQFVKATVESHWRRPKNARSRTGENVTSPVTVRIPQLTSAEAPAAIRVQESEYRYYDAAGNQVPEDRDWNSTQRAELEAVSREYRDFDGRLFREVTAEDQRETVDATPEALEEAARTTVTWVYGDTEEEARARTESLFDEYVSIDGKLWREAREPVYQAITFGLGGNHGSTSLMLAGAPSEAERFHFRLDQHDEAVEYAVTLAERRGDTKSVKEIRAFPKAEILNPESLGRQFTPIDRK